MESNGQEIITEKTLHNKEYKMREFSNLCRKDILFSCKKCCTILCNNQLIEKILRLINGKICFIIGDEDENSQLMDEFKSNIAIKKYFSVNSNKFDLKTIGLNEIFCKKCNYLLGVKIKQTDDTQIFMLNKILLKYESLKFFIISDFGIKPFQFHFKAETLKNMDKESIEIDEYIQKSGNYIQNFFDILSSQNKDLKEIEKKKTDNEIEQRRKAKEIRNYHNKIKLCNKNIGFNREFNKKDKNVYNQNNFIGIIGTYILFNDSFIKDEKSEGSIFYEKALIGLKCNYEDIIYINYKTEFSSLNQDTLYLLNKFSSDDISRFIEVIISSKSIISDKVNYFFKEKYKKSYKANYFMDKNNDKSMIYFNSENDSNNYVTYPIHFINTFNNFINDNGIKFLTLELYYFIGVIGSYSTIKNEHTHSNLKSKKSISNSINKENISNNNGNDLNNKIINELKSEKKSLYLKLQHVCNLFLYCLQLMNESQEKKFENDINNFFDTLNNLISLNSKNNFKIDYMFLSSIMNNLDLLINKKLLFKYFGFIFEYDSYEPDDEKVFKFLFRTILIYLDQYNTNFLTCDVFSKILNFDKLYLESKATKQTTKIYSRLIRKCLSLSLLNNNDECFLLYIKRLKSLTGINKQSELSSNFNDISEEELSEESESIYTSRISNKLSCKNIIQSKFSAKISLDEKIRINQLNNLKLTYKYMKNLYLCLGLDKQTNDIFIKFCLENGEKANNFFNEEFKYLTETYEISKFKYQINNLEKYEGGDYIDRNNDDSIECSEKSDESNVIISKEKEDELRIAELIKSLCIRFLDEINYDNNFKIISNELKEKKYFKDNNSLRKSVYKSSFSLAPQKKNIIQKSGEQISSINLGSAQNLAKKFDLANNSIESILTSNFEFFNNFTLSPYTFNSFFLSLFRNMKNIEKIKYIKNINKPSQKLYLDEKIHIITRFYNRIILQLIQRVGDDEDSDTFFLGKLEFFEYVYDKFYNLLLNMLNYFDEREKCKKDNGRQILKSMINNLFCSKENAFADS